MRYGRRLTLIIGSMVLLIVFGSVIYLASQYINGRKQGAGTLFGGPTNVQVVSAKELPAAVPDSRGVVLRRADNSVFVGTNVRKWQRVRDNDAAPARYEIAFDGPALEQEVLITHNTIIYRNATPLDQPRVVDGGIQEVVEPGKLADIRPDAMLQVWGERKGDRVVARVVVYSYLPV
jgi:hypothetical protein